jgi:hypothetical protein
MQEVIIRFVQFVDIGGMVDHHYFFSYSGFIFSGDLWQ